MRWKVWVPCLAAVLAACVVVVLALPREEARAGSASDFAKAANADLVKYIQGGSSLKPPFVCPGGLAQEDRVHERPRDPRQGKGHGHGGLLQPGPWANRRRARRGPLLRDLVTDTKLGAEVRKAAMSALVVHWKDSADLTWLSEKTGRTAT